MKQKIEVSTGQLLFVIMALLVLAGLSWGLSYAHFSPWAGVGIALGIAAVKASLVLLFFMELLEHRGGVRLVAMTAVAFVTVMLFLILGDVWTR